MLNKHGQPTDVARARPTSKDRPLVSLASLMSSGLVSAGSLALLTSQRVPLVPPHLVIFLVFLMQWQIMGVTAAKLGLEQLIFAAVSLDQRIYFKLRIHFLRWVIPVSLVFAVAVGMIYGVLPGLAVFATIPLDAFSIITIYELNARRHFFVTSIAGFLNYPLFFALVFALSAAVGASSTMMVLSFTFSSASRWTWLAYWRHAEERTSEVEARAISSMGLQQVLNYLLLKADQIALSVLIALGVVIGGDSFVSLFAFLSKFPELTGAGIAVMGFVVFPMVPLARRSPWEGILRTSRTGQFLVGAFAIGAVLAFACYSKLWSGTGWNWSLAIPFLIGSFSAMPANFITFDLLRRQLLTTIIRNLFLSLAAGTGVMLAFLFTRQLWLLTWIVPAQLVTFVACYTLLETGRAASLYNIRHGAADDDPTSWIERSAMRVKQEG